MENKDEGSGMANIDTVVSEAYEIFNKVISNMI